MFLKIPQHESIECVYLYFFSFEFRHTCIDRKNSDFRFHVNSLCPIQLEPETKSIFYHFVLYFDNLLTQIQHKLQIN